MNENILNFLNSDEDDPSKYPLDEMRREIEQKQDVFLHEIATEFERAADRAKRLNMKTFPLLTAANALSTFVANVVAYGENTDEEKRKMFLVNCLDSARQLWNVAKFVNTK